MVLGSMLAVSMGIALFLAIAVATRSRRREFSMLRALGCAGNELRATVRWHSLTVVVFGLVVGIPVGLAAGRTAYRAFATGIGVFPEAVVSLPWLSLLIAATVGVGLLAAIGPGNRASRLVPADILRHE